MTRKRNDNNSTEFGLWLRDQNSIDSCIGYAATNIDYVWRNYKTKKWMIIEEKRYNAIVQFSQKEIFNILNESIKDIDYKGFFILTFEKTSPEDGKIFIRELHNAENIEISKKQLLNFLKFEDDRVK